MGKQAFSVKNQKPDIISRIFKDLFAFLKARNKLSVSMFAEL